MPEVKSEPVNQKKWKETKLSPQVARFQQKKSNARQPPQKPVTQTVKPKQNDQLSQSTVNIGTTFESYDSMFQTIFGAAALCPKPQKMTENPPESIETLVVSQQDKVAIISEVTPQAGPTEESESVAEVEPEHR